MSADDQSLPSQRWFHHLELGVSLLLIAAIALLRLADSGALNELALLLLFFIPGFLGLVALANVGFEVYLLKWGTTSLKHSSSRVTLFATLALTGIIALLAVITLSIIAQTILVVTVVDTGGGVIFGPVLWAFTGGILAVVICVRFAVERFLLGERLSIAEEPV